MPYVNDNQPLRPNESPIQRRERAVSKQTRNKKGKLEENTAERRYPDSNTHPSENNKPGDKEEHDLNA